MSLIKNIHQSLLHLAFPHVCEACGSDMLKSSDMICLRCLSALPETKFCFFKANPVEKLFWGRLPLSHATAHYYFTKGSLIQHLMHAFKYKSNKELGFFLGRQMGYGLRSSGLYSGIEVLVPLPLFPAKEKKRGYNQAGILCEGISDVLNIPLRQDVIARISHTETQTKKDRIERWQNMEGRFHLQLPSVIEGKQILLVDDVITTGASLEACGRELLKAPHTELSLATLCFSSR